MHTLRYSTISPLISPPHIMRIIMVQEACTKNGMTIVFWAGVRLLLSLTTLMTDDVIRDTFLISLDTYSTSYLVLHAVHSGGSGSSAVPEVKKVSQGRTEQGGNQYSNTAESGSCLNRRTHCRPGTYSSCTMPWFTEQDSLPHASAESTPPQASSPQSGGRNECHVEHLDYMYSTLRYTTDAITEYSVVGSTEQFFLSFHKLTSFISRNRNARVL